MAAERLTVIVITRPTRSCAPADEAARITALLDSGAVDRVHVRKDEPEAARELLALLPGRLAGRLSVHRLQPVPPVWAHGAQPDAPSCSCHSLDEAEHEAPRRRYLFLSPVFDSISKPGYRAVAFNPVRVRALGRKAVALGGVTPELFGRVRGLGFAGAAMLGSAWEGDVNDFINRISCYNS